jgi:glycosyltransferase involved in cell wall biosynthesis
MDSFGGLWLNKVLKSIANPGLDAAVMVSHLMKENFVLRSAFSPHQTYVIPNAVDTIKFYPDPSLVKQDGNIYIVVVSRMF